MEMQNLPENEPDEPVLDDTPDVGPSAVAGRVDTSVVAPGVYVDPDAPDDANRYQVLRDGEVLALRGRVPTGHIPQVPGALRDFIAANPVLRTPESLREQTILEGDLPGRAGGQRPGEGDVAFLVRTKNAAIDRIEEERAALGVRIRDEFPAPGGADVAAALRSGEYTERELRDVFGDQAVLDAQQSNERRAELERVGAIQEEQRQAEAAERADLERRIEEAGGLVPALFSDNPNERITREQAESLGYDPDGIDLAIEAERDFVRERGEFEEGVRDQAAQQRELALLADYQRGDEYDLTDALADGVSESTLRKAGFRDEDIESAVASITARQVDSAERSESLRRLEAYAGEDEGTYNVSLALATGAISEDEARELFGDDVEDAIAGAQAIREAADRGYYVSGELVPNDLRSALLLRSAELSASAGRLRESGDFEGVAQRQLEAVAIIDDFLANGGPIPDVRVADLDTALRTNEGQLARAEAEYANAVDLYGEAGVPSVLAQQRRSLLRERDALEARRADALAEAVRNPLPELPGNALEVLARRAAAEPAEVGGEIAREAALFAATSVAARLALRGTLAAGRAVGTVVRETRPAFINAVKAAIRDQDGFIRLGPALSREEKIAARALLERAEREVAQAADRSRLAGSRFGPPRAQSDAALEQTLRSLRASTGTGQSIALSEDQVRALMAASAGSTTALREATRSSSTQPFGFVETPEPTVAPDVEDAPESPDEPSPVTPLRITDQDFPDEPKSPDVPLPVTPVVIPDDPADDPFEPGRTPVPSPFDVPAVPEPEPTPQPETQPSTDPDTGTETEDEDEQETQPGVVPGTVPDDQTDVQPTPGTATVPDAAMEDQVRQDLDVGAQPSFEDQLRGDLTGGGVVIGGGEPFFSQQLPTPPARAPAPRRGRPPQRKASKDKRRPPLNPEWVGHKQGFIYRYKNMQTGDEVYSLTPLTGKVPNVKGKGSAKKSQRVVTRTARRTRPQVDNMGAVDVVYGKGGKIVNFKRSRKIRGRRG